METSNIFDRIASRYDTEDRMTIARIIAEAIRLELKDSRPKSALDYGCGTGLVGLELIDLFQSILFADASPQMIEQVKRKIDMARINSADTLCADFLQGVPAGLQFDCVIMSQTLLHVKNYPLLLENLYAALNHDGQLIIVDFDKNEDIISDMVHNGFDQNELINLIKQIGFSFVGSHTFYHGEKIFMNMDASIFILTAQK